jgi:putative spermidine/putrescine transport system permease protein
MKIDMKKSKREKIQLILLLLPGAGFIFFFFGFSLVSTILRSFQVEGQPGYTLANYAVLFKPYFIDSTLFSIWLGVASAFGSLLIAFPFCLLLRKNFFGNRALSTIIKIPLFITGLVATFLIMNFLSPHGMFNLILIKLNIIKEPLRIIQGKFGLGITIIEIWKNVPFQLLIIMAVMESINPVLIEAAQDLGASKWQVIRHILIPLSMPGILVAVILVFIGAYGGFEIAKLAGAVYPMALPVLMYDSINEMNNWDTGSLIGTIIIISAILMVFLYTKIASKIQGGDVV